MDRAEAIKVLEATATEMLGCFAGTISDNYAKFMQRRIDALDMAIAALREQEQREQGCEFCNADYAVMSASYMTTDFMHKSITPKFCALCGRKLGGSEE